MKNQRRLRARKRQRQQGAALLIVLFVLLMATTTAVYSLSSTQFEVRAAGALHQSMRAKFVSEAATTGILAVCYQLSNSGCTDNKIDVNNITAAERQTYALPDWSTETVSRIIPTDYQGTAFVAAMLPNDKTVSGISTGGGGIAGTWSPDFLSTIEKSTITAQEAGKPGTYRLVVSTYGALQYDTDDNVTTVEDSRHADEQRLAHSTISTTRAFIDL